VSACLSVCLVCLSVCLSTSTSPDLLIEEGDVLCFKKFISSIQAAKHKKRNYKEIK